MEFLYYGGMWVLGEWSSRKNNIYGELPQKKKGGGALVICRCKGWLDEKEEFFWRGGGGGRGGGVGTPIHALCLHSKPPATVDASIEGLFHHNFIWNKYGRKRQISLSVHNFYTIDDSYM